MTASSNIDRDSLQTYQDFAKGNDRFESLTVNTRTYRARVFLANKDAVPVLVKSGIK
jgi:hypothetical protein